MSEAREEKKANFMPGYKWHTYSKFFNRYPTLKAKRCCTDIVPKISLFSVSNFDLDSASTFVSRKKHFIKMYHCLLFIIMAR